jgi:D-beta-D-heptose 7-phosphate kinase / D-beta-D-heptose 1-phosphate adenosyltransferase
MSSARSSTPHSTLCARSSVSLEEMSAAGFRQFAANDVLIVGDLILDHYLWGSVERTTPEAPVPIVRHERDSWTLGGAANVAHNVAALGGRPRLVGVIGKDTDGELLKSHLREAGIAVAHVVTDPARPTTVKTRIMSMGQQVLRMDREDTAPLSSPVVRKVIASVRALIPKSRIVILSDYGKGALSDEVVTAIRDMAHHAGIAVLVDPKGRNYEKYRGVDLLTPNQKEASLASGISITSVVDLEQAARAIIRQCHLNALVVTRGAEGIAVMRTRRPAFQAPAKAREVFDVTGAGDTTIATLGLGLAAGLSLEDAAILANHAGGIVVGKLGVATVSPAELKAALDGGASPNKIRTLDELRILVANQQTRGRKVALTNGCFDLLHPGHIRFLHEARRQGDLLVIALNTDRSVRALKGQGRPILPQDERAAILSALESVDYVVLFDELTPDNLLRELRPDVLVKGRNIAENEIVGRDIVESYGGRVCRLPILHTSNVGDLVDSILETFHRGGRKSGSNRKKR